MPNDHHKPYTPAAACKTNKLAFTFLATSAAPISPSVFDTELPIAGPDALSSFNSPLRSSTAILLDLPSRTIIDRRCEEVVEASAAASSVSLRRGVDVE